MELWGLVTDLDLVAAAWAGVDDERTAGESAVVPLVTVRSDDRLRDAAQLMAENGVSSPSHTRQPPARRSSLVS